MDVQIRSTTVRKIQRPNRPLDICLFAVTLSIALSGCEPSRFDQPGAPPRPTVTQEESFTTVLRPGESDSTEFNTTESYSGGLLASGLVQTSQAASCLGPGIPCTRVDFSATGDTEASGLEFLPRGDGLPPYPVSVIGATTMTAPAIVALDGGGGGGDPFSSELAMFSIALAEDGSVWTWGANSFGQLGDDSRINRPIPQRVAGISNIVAVAAGGAHALALDASGLVWSWGDNSFEQLGRGSSSPSHRPAPIAGLPIIVRIAAGRNFSLALDESGQVWGWGESRGDVLQTDSRIERRPVLIRGLSRIVAIAAGAQHGLAIDQDRVTWSWGTDFEDRTGTAPQTRFTNSAAIAAGSSFSLVLDRNGAVHSWGSNTYSMLGRTDDEPIDCEDLPVCVPNIGRVIGVSDIVQIEAGGAFAVARNASGRVYAWGANDLGQFAGLPATQLLPIELLRVEDSLLLATGVNFVLSLPAAGACSVPGFTFGGRVVTWGDNRTGQRGDGTAVNWPAPTPVPGLGETGSCNTSNGHNLIVYKGGAGAGSIMSDAPGMRCTGVICWQAIRPGSTVTLTAVPDAGSSFTEWRWDCTAGSALSASVTMNQHTICKAVFEQGGSNGEPAPDPVLSLTLVGEGQATSDNGIDCPGVCSAGAPAGSPIALTATPTDGWQFDGYSGDADCADGMITLNSDTACTVLFSEIAAPMSQLTLDVSGSGTVQGDAAFVCTATGPNQSCSANYPTNSNVSLRGLPLASSDATNWLSGCDNGSGFLPTCEMLLTGDRTIAARFEAPPSGSIDGVYNGTLTWVVQESTTELLGLGLQQSYSLDVVISGSMISISAGGVFVDVAGVWDAETQTFSDLSATEASPYRVRADGAIFNGGIDTGGRFSLTLNYLVADDANGQGSIYRFDGTNP